MSRGRQKAKILDERGWDTTVEVRDATRGARVALHVREAWGKCYMAPRKNNVA